MHAFPLFQIVQLVDATLEHEMLSFMDAYSGYRHIRMHLSNKAPTVLYVYSGVLYYKVMPFKLVNMGVTNQRMLYKLFTSMLLENIETYVDNMLVKYVEGTIHIPDLREAFQMHSLTQRPPQQSLYFHIQCEIKNNSWDSW